MKRLCCPSAARATAYLSLLGAVLLLVAPGAAQEPKSAGSPLEPLGRLVGGYWYFEGGKPLNAYHEFTWGPNRRSVHATFYLVGDGSQPDRVRADGFFYWHPVKQKISSLVAGAGGEVYDGGYAVEGNTLTHDFEYHTGGKTTPFRETMVFPDNDTYVWTLYLKTGIDMKQQIQATVRRVKEKPTAAAAK